MDSPKMGVSKNKGFNPPNHPFVHRVWFSIIFTIHFGGFPPIFGNIYVTTVPFFRGILVGMYDCHDLVWVALSKRWIASTSGFHHPASMERFQSQHRSAKFNFKSLALERCTKIRRFIEGNFLQRETGVGTWRKATLLWYLQQPGQRLVLMNTCWYLIISKSRNRKIKNIPRSLTFIFW